MRELRPGRRAAAERLPVAVAVVLAMALVAAACVGGAAAVSAAQPSAASASATAVSDPDAAGAGAGLRRQLGLAVDADQAVLKAKAALAAAEAELQQVAGFGFELSPRVGASADGWIPVTGPDETSLPATTATASVGVLARLRTPVGAFDGDPIARAERAVAEAQAGLAQARLGAAIDVLEAWAASLKAQWKLETAERAAELARTNWDAVKQRGKQGSAGEVQRLQAQLGLLQAEDALREARREAEQEVESGDGGAVPLPNGVGLGALEALADGALRRLGLDEVTAVDEGQEADRLDCTAERFLVDQALEHSPELVGPLLRLREAESKAAQTSGLLGDWSPTFTTSASYRKGAADLWASWQSNSGDLEFRASTSQDLPARSSAQPGNWSVSAEFQLGGLFDSGRSASRDESRAEMERAQADWEQQRAAVANQVRAACTALHRAWASVKVAELEHQIAHLMAEAVAKQAQAGAASGAEVDSARLQEMRAQQDLNEARLDTGLAALRLAVAVGMDPAIELWPLTLILQRKGEFPS